MNSKYTLRRFIGDMPVENILNTLINLQYASAKVKKDYITQLASHPDHNHMKIEELKDLQTKAVRQSLTYHYNRCSSYRNLCGDLPVVNKFEDIFNIPQIHAEEFKNDDFLSIDKSKIVSVITTSDLSGTYNKLPRDMTSQMRLMIQMLRYILTSALPLVADYSGRSIKEARRYALNNWAINFLTPPPNESSSLIVKIFEGILPVCRMLNIKTSYFLNNMEFDPEKAFNDIKEINKDNKMMMFVGFHYIFSQIMDYMDEIGERLNLDPTGKNICIACFGGGWKTLDGKKVDKDQFKDKLKEYFGLNDLFIVDAYSFAEANFVTLDLCPSKKSHLVLPVVIRTRDPETLELQDYGETGIISVWDPFMNSYPAFIMTDDVGIVSDYYKCDDCGFVGQDLILKGRLSKAEFRSCGLKLQQMMEEKRKERVLATGYV